MWDATKMKPNKKTDKKGNSLVKDMTEGDGRPENIRKGGRNKEKK